MAISATQIYLLNRMNRIAQKVGLGTLIQVAETLGSAFGSLASGKILVGQSDASALAVTPTGDVTISAAGVTAIGAGKVTAVMLADGTKDTYETFNEPILQQNGAGAAPTGTTNDVNYFFTGKHRFQWHVKGTQTIVHFPWAVATGLTISQDLVDNDGTEITQGITSASKVAMTAGTDRFYFQAKIKIADVSGADDVLAGWRKAEAYQAAVDSYDEMAALNVIGGDVTIETILNNGTTAATDTTVDIADGEYAILRVEHDHTVGLTRAIALATDLRTKYNAHCADATHHTTLADAANLVTAAVPTTLATLITLVTQMLTKYDAHEGDSELANTWLYHEAQEAGNVSLVSTAAPTTLPLCIARLNDLKAKFTAHDADTTTHGAAGGHACTTADAGSMTVKVGANSATIAVPGTVAAFTFDDGEVVVPFVYFLHATTAPGLAYLQHWEVGLLA